MSSYTDDQHELIRKLEQLADYAGKEAGRVPSPDRRRPGRVRPPEARRGTEGLETDDRLISDDVRAFAADIRPDFPKAADGCELFVLIAHAERTEAAPYN